MSLTLAGYHSSVGARRARLALPVKGATYETAPLVDRHLPPMTDCFQQAPEGADMISGRPNLARWVDWMQARPEAVALRPDLMRLNRKDSA